MEAALSILAGLCFALGVYLLLSRALIRVIIGILVLGNGVNIAIFTAGRLTATALPIVPAGLARPLGEVANALPQALILTAIVIGFAMFAFLLVLAMRADQAIGIDDNTRMRVAEPEGHPNPPLDY
jgi:multicomponent Na+:H+ antiporter subunit C